MDMSPLRELPAFRQLWFSSLITRFGSMITYVAAPYQIKELTGSYVAVGVLGVLETIPLIIFGLYGGTLADRVDRKHVVLATEFALMSCVLLLAINSRLEDPRVWVIYLVAMLAASADGIQGPSLNAIVPRIVPSEKLAAASALNSLTHSVGFIFGTMLGGVLVASVGFTYSYIFDALTFGVSMLLLLKLPRIAPTRQVHESPLPAIVESVRYAWSRKDLLGTYLIDTAAMVFAYPVALFPFLADQLDSPQSLGLLYAAGAVGAAFATLTSGWTARIRRHGMAVVYAAMIWGIGIAIVGLSNSLPLALLGLAIAGAADMVSGLFRSLIWNMSIPDDLRGRMAGIEMLSYSIGPQLGQVRSSFSAQLFGLNRAFISGGLLCTATVGACAAALPTLRNYRSEKL
ncbi:MAG: MFS transporter [Actinobacteria bacterium]|uniref:Multidrug efflux pump Tap n=1 Tax=freshwater metagenome TaxID=449393 RepID=A0A6J5YSQ0_9ZZZZ|nr:MFS transporter [Actinomycetota bacterium]